jgi:hypothetical protein
MFFVLDSRATPSLKNEACLWGHLWEMRDFTPVSVVVPTVVTSSCPLLVEENADAILSSTGMQVPQDSAWVPMQVDVSGFQTHSGEIRLGALEAALRDCVDRGDALHDAQAWPSRAMQYDSWLNRRLAVSICGWGELVRNRGADPTVFQTLKDLEELANFIFETMRARSRALASERGYCPAVDLAGASIHAGGKEMRLRWQRAVDGAALRHRNLITMSVWDIFPRRRPADTRYFDLLPILRCANCLSFRREVDIKHWNVVEFRRFYERLIAILQSNIDAGRIAKQV